MSWSTPFDISGMNIGFVISVAVLTALTAGVGEELFYRRWLQSRLETILGPTLGVLVVALIFSLMHVGSHGTGQFWTDMSRAVVIQGSFGLMLGILWLRFRNTFMIVALHVIANGGPVAVAIGRQVLG